MREAWNFPGSKWWKFDFHTHTPASDDYGRGDQALKDIRAEGWLKCAMDAGLDCVAVTDHNTGGWIDALKEKNKELADSDTKADWYRPLIIYPGVEITVADSSRRVHLLAVFDPDCCSQKIFGVLGSCGITSGFGDEKQTFTTTGFVETVRKINEANGIAIPAHIDGSNGLLSDVTTLTPELTKSLDTVTAAEFCNLDAFNDAEFELKTAVDRLAKLGGSDAHVPGHIGKYYSWLKMSKPSVDGVRLALLDHDYCVRNQSEDPNRLPDLFLSKLTIQNMQRCGRGSIGPFVADFNPHFNAVIGGRGTGKSTLLESIRIVLRRDQNLAVEAPRVKDELDTFMKSAQNKGVMLDSTEILLELHRRGKTYRLRWRFDGQGTVLEEEIGGRWQAIEAGDLIERFPIRIFSQKQINELASNPRGLLEVIDHSQDVNRAEWQPGWESAKSEFLLLRERRRELLRQLAGEQSLRVKLSDVENDLRQYEERGHKAVFKQYQQRNRQKNGLIGDRIFDDLSSGMRELASTAELSDFPMHLFDDDEFASEIRMIHEKSGLELQKIRETLEVLAESVDTLQAQRRKDIASSKWNQAVLASIAAYDTLVKEHQDKQNRFSVSLYGEWVHQRNLLHAQLKKLDAVREEIQSIEKQIDDTLTTLQELRLELLVKRKRFLDACIGSNTFVRMELVPYGDVSTVEEEYRSLLGLDNGIFINSVYDSETKQGILGEFCNWENAGTPESDLSGLIAAIKAETQKIASGKSSGNHGAFDNRLKKLLETQPAVFDQLDAWWPEDMLRVKYSRDPSSGKFDDLEKGSAGQKAAAILAFLLSHGSEPLVIDQPEDDLDNALIYDLIVKQIHENKNGRQLIIATHNPNIVVNGDSELVHVLKFENGQVQIDRQGGMEERCIRESICAIMEGGREAFDKRYRRITLKA